MVARSREQSFTSEETEFLKQEDRTSVEKGSAEELQGKLGKDNREDKLMHTVMDVDKDKVEKASVLTDAINNNISSFTPDLSFEQMVNNYRNAKKLMGETLIRELTGYAPGFVEKNIRVPEFQRELKERIKQNTDKLKKEGLLDSKGFITDQAYDYEALSMLSEELDELEGKGLLGRKESRKRSEYGEKQDTRRYKKGDKFRNVSWRHTVNKSMRRGHNELEKEDFVVHEKMAKGKVNIIYALDNSGSMKGDKIKVAKKSGIALAYKATQHNDKTGLIVFNSKIDNAITPTHDFETILREIARIKTTGETDIALCIHKALELYPNSKETNHLILLTDALQTLGKKPEKKVLETASRAASANVSISIIGINMDRKGEELARKIADISKGTLYKIRNLEEIDSIILEDYYQTKTHL